MVDYRARSYVDMDVNPSVTEKLSQLQAIRSTPLDVTSGYRSPSYNAKVGGAKHSQHTHRNAVDISTRGMSQAEVNALAAEASRLGFNGIGFYSGSLHFDVRQTPAAWGPNYRSSSIPGWAKEVAQNHLNRAYQGTAPAPAIAAVERQDLPAVGPVVESKPTQETPQLASYTAPTPTAKPFDRGFINNPPKANLSPVSPAQAAPAQMARTEINPTRFGPMDQTPQPGSAAIAAAYSKPSPTMDRVTAPQTQVAAAPQALSYSPVEAPTRSFTPAPASYQQPAFSTAPRQMDAFQQAPAPGVQPAASNPYASYSTLAEAAAAQTAPTAAPTLEAPTRTISNPKVASVPAQIEAPANPAPAPDPKLNSFPSAPNPGLLSSLLNPTTLASAAIGNMAFGPVGGLLGGLLGSSVNKSGGLGGLLGAYNGPTNNIGSGLGAISQVRNGAPAGTTATSRSMPGMSVTSLPGGGIQRTNQYGVTQITTPDGRLAAPSKNTKGSGKGGNYGGISSPGARSAIDHGIGGLF